MRQHLYYTVMRWFLRGSVLSYVVQRERRQRDTLFRWTHQFARLSRLLPVEIACQEISRVLPVIPAHAVVALSRQLSDLCIQDKKTLLLIAQTLAFHGEYEDAQSLLWRGIRLYGEDIDVWEHALRISLERLLSRASFVEWQQSYHRFKYIVAEIPPDAKQHPTIRHYLLFATEQGRHLCEDLSFYLWLWQKGRVDDARNGLRLWWTELQSQSSFPETAARLTIWYMFGLGMFAEVANDPSAQRLTPNIAAVANWFNGAHLPASPRGYRPDLLWLLTQWAQHLTEARYPPIGIVWRSLLTARRYNETFITHMLLAATFGFGRVTLRQHFARYWEAAGLEWFLPYLHFLCVAFARLRWEAEAQKIWRLMDLMNVEYARKEELRKFLRRHLPHIE